jgi:hypothetical protein
MAPQVVCRFATQWLFRGESVVATDAAGPSREQADISAITPSKQGRTPDD